MVLHERLAKIGVGERRGGRTRAAGGIAQPTAAGDQSGCDEKCAGVTRNSVGLHRLDPWVPRGGSGKAASRNFLDGSPADWSRRPEVRRECAPLCRRPRFGTTRIRQTISTARPKLAVLAGHHTDYHRHRSEPGRGSLSTGSVWRHRNALRVSASRPTCTWQRDATAHAGRDQRSSRRRGGGKGGGCGRRGRVELFAGGPEGLSTLLLGPRKALARSRNQLW